MTFLKSCAPWFAAFALVGILGARLADRHVDPTYGFSIEPPAFMAAHGSALTMAVQFFAPAENGFAPNVNVCVQEAKTTRDTYVETTKAQFKSMDFVTDSVANLMVDGKEAVIMEYHGTMSKHPMHWLALAVICKERVYLVTGTALEEQFPKLKDTFSKCLRSFKPPADGSGKAG